MVGNPHIEWPQTADYKANELPEGYSSTLGEGKTGPDPSQAIHIDGDVLVPLGTPVDRGVQNVSTTALLFFEVLKRHVCRAHCYTTNTLCMILAKFASATSCKLSLCINPNVGNVAVRLQLMRSVAEPLLAAISAAHSHIKCT